MAHKFTEKMAIFPGGSRTQCKKLSLKYYKTNSEMSGKKQNLGVWSWREEAGDAHSEDEYWDPGAHQRKDGCKPLTVVFVNTYTLTLEWWEMNSMDI